MIFTFFHLFYNNMCVYCEQLPLFKQIYIIWMYMSEVHVARFSGSSLHWHCVKWTLFKKSHSSDDNRSASTLVCKCWKTSIYPWKSCTQYPTSHIIIIIIHTWFAKRDKLFFCIALSWLLTSLFVILMVHFFQDLFSSNMSIHREKCWK